MKKLCTILIASLSLMCSGFGLVYAQTPVCDEFDGSTINTAMWNPASGTWTQSGGRITGYWPLGSAHGEQGDLILTDAVQPTGNYTFEADMVNTSASGQGSPRINLYNSAGNKYTIVFESWSRGVTTALKQNSGSFQSLDPLGYYATNIDAFQTGAGVINTAKIVKHDSNQFTAYVNDVELFTIVDDVWNGDVNIGLGAYGYSTYERACFTSGGQVPGDLVAFWPMDETSGATVADMSGHHLDGTAGGTTIITGQVGNARSLNGTSDYIEVPDNDLLDLTDEITIMLWAKFDPTDAEGFLINKRLYSDAACEINYDIKYGFSGGNLYLAFQYGTGCATGNSYSLTNLTGMGDGAWHHLAVSLHFGDPSSAQWMIDGTARAGTWTKWNGTPGGGTDIPPTNSNALEMGRQLSSSPGYAKCSMDQVRLYGRALSVGEMQGVYSSEAGTQGPIPTILTLTCPVTSCRTGESVLFTATLTDDQGGPLAGKTINFNWSYSGLEPAENFAGSFSATTDLLGQCTLNWFSKWAAFTGNVTATISAVFTGDMIYSPCSDYAQLPVEFIEAQIHARIFKDLNGNGVWDPEAENLVPNIPMIVTSVYNDFEMVVSSSDGEYSIFVPKCAYQIKAVIEEEGNQQNLVDFINVTDFAIPGNVAVVNLPFVPLGIVRGTIYRDYYTQAGFPGASVSIFRASDHVELESIRSDENGNFSFRVPCGQVYGVWITADYNNSCLVRFEQASLVGCVEYAFGINLGLNDWWREWLYADHCMDAWVHAEPNIGTIQERECIYNATMGLMGLIPALCAVPVADDLCNFVESVGQSVAAGEPLSISDAAWQLDLIIVDMLGCMLAQPQFQSVLKHISIGAEVLKNWKNFENLAALLDLINAWQSCLNQITEMQQNLVTPSNAYHALAISGERGNVAAAAITHSPIWLTVLDPVGDSICIDMNGGLVRSSFTASAIFRDGTNHEIVLFPLSYDGYVIRIRPKATIVRDTVFSITILQPSSSHLFKKSEFSDVPMSPSGIAEIRLRETQFILTLVLDTDGDGIADHIIEPTATVMLGNWSELEGYIKSNSTDGLPAVPLDIYDSLGNLWKSVVTDDTGFYHIDSIPNGDYTISVVTPLGYQADQETKEFTIHHVPVTVDFTLTKLDVTSRPRTRAWWANQLQRALWNCPGDYNRAAFARFAGFINQHFNQNQLNPVDFYSVPQPASQQDSLMAMKRLLHMTPEGEDDPFLKRLGKAQLMALMLNVVSGKIHQMQEISPDGISVSQAITYCDMLVNDEIDPPNDGGPGCGQQFFRYLRADFILTLINLGLRVPPRMIPTDVIEIAYKLHVGETLPEGFSLQQNYPNPFNPATEIRFSLPEAAQVKLDVYDILGRNVATLLDESLEAGEHIVQWDGRDVGRRDVASGIYFYRLVTGGFAETKKMVLLR